MIFCTSGQKPMSIMRSASSSTSTCTRTKSVLLVPHVIHQPARRGDDDVDAGLQRAFLRSHLDAAEHRRRRHRRVVGQADERVLDLHRQLARRRQDQRARVRLARRIAVARLLAEQPLDDRRRKRQRLAGAGLGARDDVVAVERERNHRALHRSRAVEAEIREGRPRAAGRSPSSRRGPAAASASTISHGRSGGGGDGAR